MSDATLGEVLAVVVTICEEQRRLVKRLLERHDRRDLRTVLPVAHALMSDTVWTSAELAAAARSKAALELLEVIADHADEGGGLRGFGQLLARCEDATARGLQLLRVGDDAWRVHVPRPSKHAPAVDQGAEVRESLTMFTQQARRR